MQCAYCGKNFYSAFDLACHIKDSTACSGKHDKAINELKPRIYP